MKESKSVWRGGVTLVSFAVYSVSKLTTRKWIQDPLEHNNIIIAADEKVQLARARFN